MTRPAGCWTGRRTINSACRRTLQGEAGYWSGCSAVRLRDACADPRDMPGPAARRNRRTCRPTPTARSTSTSARRPLTASQGGELGSDRALRPVRGAVPLLRPRAAALRQELGAARHRENGMTRRPLRPSPSPSRPSSARQSWTGSDAFPRRSSRVTRSDPLAQRRLDRLAGFLGGLDDRGRDVAHDEEVVDQARVVHVAGARRRRRPARRRSRGPRAPADRSRR